MAYQGAGVKFLTALAAMTLAAGAQAQQLDVHFSCGAQGKQLGLKGFLADSGRIRINGTKIEEFSLESSLFHANNGVECSIDEGDGLRAEFIGEPGRAAWRVLLKDAEKARNKRGYDMVHGLNCAVRIEQVGNDVRINPSCPALCGSRQDFSAFRFDTKTGKCTYENEG